MVVSKIEGHLAISKLERRAVAKFYYFMVVNVFFGNILSGYAFQQLKTFVSSITTLGCVVWFFDVVV
jgi:predicted small integral membrane protein